MTNDLFVSLALERALTCLPMPKFGITQQLNREEVSDYERRRMLRCITFNYYYYSYHYYY